MPEVLQRRGRYRSYWRAGRAVAVSRQQHQRVMDAPPTAPAGTAAQHPPDIPCLSSTSYYTRRGLDADSCTGRNDAAHTAISMDPVPGPAQRPHPAVRLARAGVLAGFSRVGCPTLQRRPGTPVTTASRSPAGPQRVRCPRSNQRREPVPMHQIRARPSQHPRATLTGWRGTPRRSGSWALPPSRVKQRRQRPPPVRPGPIRVAERRRLTAVSPRIFHCPDSPFIL